MIIDKRIDELSMRGRLVEEVLKSYVHEHAWDFVSKNEDEKIKLELNKHLSFETTVKKVENKNKRTFTQIYFEDEYGIKRAIDFTVVHDLKPIDSIIYQ